MSRPSPAAPGAGRARGTVAYWAAAGALALLAGAGVAALAARLAGGPEPRAKWGYPAATLAFLLSTALSAPPLAFASRLARGHWGIALRRTADLLALGGLVAAPLGLILLLQLPDWRGRPSIWLDWPGAPRLWDAGALVVLALLGLALAYAGALPDLAAGRDAGGGRLVRRLALGWKGSARRWDVTARGVLTLGALYLMFLTFVHLLVVSDLAMSLVPGWASANMPPYHAVTGLEGGVATTIVLLAAVRRLGGLEGDVSPDTFRAAGKLLLALALLWFYFAWSEFLTYWYGRTPNEQRLLALLMFGPYRGPFLLAFGLSFLAPFLLLIWNRVRSSVAGVTLAAGAAVLGCLFDRVRLYVPAWQVAGPVGAELAPLPPARPPDLADAAVFVGAVAAVGLVYLLALRLVPPVSRWELRWGELLRTERPYARTTVPVLAKPS